MFAFFISTVALAVEKDNLRDEVNRLNGVIQGLTNPTVPTKPDESTTVSTKPDESTTVAPTVSTNGGATTEETTTTSAATTESTSATTTPPTGGQGSR